MRPAPGDRQTQRCRRGEQAVYNDWMFLRCNPASYWIRESIGIFSKSFGHSTGWGQWSADMVMHCSLVPNINLENQGLLSRTLRTSTIGERQAVTVLGYRLRGERKNRGYQGLDALAVGWSPLKSKGGFGNKAWFSHDRWTFWGHLGVIWGRQ